MVVILLEEEEVITVLNQMQANQADLVVEEVPLLQVEVEELLTQAVAAVELLVQLQVINLVRVDQVSLLLDIK
tara:strand:+ start:360 stop:578 length:219 start_codon:yes stop_codon:yes gene_type:complete